MHGGARRVVAHVVARAETRDAKRQGFREIRHRRDDGAGAGEPRDVVADARPVAAAAAGEDVSERGEFERRGFEQRERSQKRKEAQTDEGGASGGAHRREGSRAGSRQGSSPRARAVAEGSADADSLLPRVHAGGPAAVRDVRAPQRGHRARVAGGEAGGHLGRLRGAAALGKIQRELAMFRGAHTWAKGALFKAVERGRRAAGAAAHDDASDSDDGEYASVREAGGSTFVPTRRLDNAALYREGARGVHKNGDKNKNVGASIDDRDPGFVPGSPFVAGVDAVLDVAETFAGGTGEHMGKPERDLLLAPDIAPALPGQSSKKAATEGKASKTPYTQDVYRGHTRPVVFLDVLPDSGSLLSVDADGLMCLWSAFQGNAGRCGFGWFSPMGTWRLPAEVTAQVPSGFPVEVSAGAGKFTPSTHAPWIASRVGKLATVFEAPKDDAWIAEDAKAARAVAALSAPRTYGEQLELEPVRRRLDIPGVDPDLETPEQKWRKGQGEVGDLDPALDARTLDTKTGVVIPKGEAGLLREPVRRRRAVRPASAATARHAPRRADRGRGDRVGRRHSRPGGHTPRLGRVAAAAQSRRRGRRARLGAVFHRAPTRWIPWSHGAAHGHARPFLPPKGRGALDAKRSRAKPGAALEQAGALARGAGRTPRRALRLAKSTPASGSGTSSCRRARSTSACSASPPAPCVRTSICPACPRRGAPERDQGVRRPHPTSCGRAR